MRLRKLHNAKEILTNAKDFFINDAFSIEKKWEQIFNNKNNIEIEIGMGKGQFIIDKAISYPDTNFIGIELNETICAKAIKKILMQKQIMTNLKIININAKKLDEIFNNKQIQKIYLNFSDPWPKKRHIKNRLTSDSFLNIYKKIIKKNGIIEFKTDNDNFYNWTLENLKLHKDVKILYKTNDLYKNLNNKYNKNNIQTEYEQKFVSQNKNINKLVFVFL